MKQQVKREHWTNVLEQQKHSGLTVKQFCFDNKINYQTFLYMFKTLCEVRELTKSWIKEYNS